MVLPTKRTVRKKKLRKKHKLPGKFGRIFAFLLLLCVLIFSICAVGYVIFFQTVLAANAAGSLGTVVFEEPDPPGHDEPGVQGAVALVDDLPKVAIIFDDIGFDEGLGERLLSYPIELTYSFLPFAPYTERLEKKASLAGKTIFLHLPLEPKDTRWDPGRGALLLADSHQTQLTKLEECLKKVPHAVGVNTHMGSLYTEDRAAMTFLMQEIGRRSLLFVDSYTTAASVGLEAARQQGITSGRRQIFLDNDLTAAKICEQLTKLVEIAERQGRGIGIAHPHQVTVDTIASCAVKFQKRVQYVSVKDVLLSDTGRE